MDRSRVNEIGAKPQVRIGLALLAILVVVGLVALLLGSGGDHSSAGPEAESPAAPRRLPCTVTVDAGVDLAVPLARAQAGAVLCLRGGSYPGARIPAEATDKHGYVTVQPSNGASPVFSGELAFDGARHLRLEELSFRAGISFTPEAEAVQLIRNDITGPGGIFFFGDAEQGGSSSQILIAGNRIHDIDYTGPQDGYQGYGIKSIGVQHGFTVRGNTIASVAADYIQTDVANDWTVAGNTFLGPTLVGGHPEEHQDLWQVYAGGRKMTFENNIARHTGTGESLLFQLTYPGDRFSDVVVENNLFDHDSAGYSCQIYQVNSLVFRANTVVGSRFGCVFRHDDRFPGGSAYSVEHNVFAETTDGSDLGVENGVQRWGSFDYNVSSDDSATGRNSVPNWDPEWENLIDYPPLGLPISAGFRPNS